MAELKTKQHDGDVYEFINTFADTEQKRVDSKAAISLYVFTGAPEHEYLLKDLGKVTMGKACIYAKKLSDINLEALEKLMLATIEFLEEKHGKVNRD